DCGIGHEYVEPPVTLVQCGAKARDAVGILQVERDERRRAAGTLDFVVEFLEPAHGARNRNHMRAGFCKRKRGRPPDAARCAGDESDAVDKRVRHSMILILRSGAKRRVSKDEASCFETTRNSAAPQHEGIMRSSPAMDSSLSPLRPAATIDAAGCGARRSGR